MKNPDSKTIVTDLDPKATAYLMRIIRKSRMGKVRRQGRKNHRTYFVEPRNREEMTLEARRLMVSLPYEMENK